MSKFRVLSLLSIGFIFMSHIVAYGQNMNDIFTFQNHTVPYGTARFMGMGGAMGAVGGDISSSYINPAGGALALKDEVSATMGIEWTSNDALFYGNREKDNSLTYANLFQAGANLVYILRNEDSSFDSFNIGINYSRGSNFNNRFSWKGRNTTVTDWAGGQPIGSSIIEEVFRDANDGYNTSAVYMAENLGVISHHRDSYGDYYLPEAQYNNIEQAASMITRGYSGITTVSAGMNIQNKIYLGIGFDFFMLDIKQNDIFMNEEGFTRSSDLWRNGVNYLWYDSYSDQSGWGSNFSLGIIGKVTESLRLGFSWKSPTRIYIDEYYSYRMGASFYDGYSKEDSDNPTFGGPNQYSFKSPSEWTVSAAYVFGQIGLLSVDYMLKDFSAMQFKDDHYFDYENEIIRDQMKICHTVRVGGEIRLYPVSIRAGFNYISSPYKNVEVERVSQHSAGGKERVSLPQGVGDTMNASMGIGVNIGKSITIDATYLGSKTTRYQYLYSPVLTDAVQNDILSHHIAIGASWKF